MFSRHSEPDHANKVITSGPPAPPPVPSTHNPSAPRGLASTLVDRTNASVIGRDLMIIGQQILIVTQGVLQVDGDVRADLRGKEIVIGENGKVTGEVAAETVEVRGEVNGTIKGLTVALLPSARVDGDIHHQRLSIAEGAMFDGRVRRPKDPSELQPILDPNEFGNGLVKTPSSD